MEVYQLEGRLDCCHRAAGRAADRPRAFGPPSNAQQGSTAGAPPSPIPPPASLKVAAQVLQLPLWHLVKLDLQGRAPERPVHRAVRAGLPRTETESRVAACAIRGLHLGKGPDTCCSLERVVPCRACQRVDHADPCGLAWSKLRSSHGLPAWKGPVRVKGFQMGRVRPTSW